MTTRADLRNLMRRRLGDLTAPYTQSDLQINQWINDAIADYSIRFPQVKTGQLTATTGTHVYSLFTDLMTILRVEYPISQDPIEYLKRIQRDDSGADYGDGYYEIMESGSATAPTIWISNALTTGQKVNITYQAAHDSLDDDGDVATVPDRHLELLVLFCRWVSLQEMASEEMRNPDPSSLISSVIDTSAKRAEDAYRKSLDSFVKAEATGRNVAWKMENDRIY